MLIVALLLFAFACALFDPASFATDLRVSASLAFTNPHYFDYSQLTPHLDYPDSLACANQSGVFGNCKFVFVNSSCFALVSNLQDVQCPITKNAWPIVVISIRRRGEHLLPQPKDTVILDNTGGLFLLIANQDLDVLVPSGNYGLPDCMIEFLTTVIQKVPWGQSSSCSYFSLITWKKELTASSILLQNLARDFQIGQQVFDVQSKMNMMNQLLDV